MHQVETAGKESVFVLKLWIILIYKYNLEF